MQKFERRNASLIQALIYLVIKMICVKYSSWQVMYVGTVWSRMRLGDADVI